MSELRLATTILTADLRDALPRCLTGLGQRVTLINGANHLAASGHLGDLTDVLTEADYAVDASICLGAEPDADWVDSHAEQLNQSDVLVAIGGGSVIDGAKALAAVATADHTVRHFCEGVPGGGHALTTPPLPVIAIPTTAGTGAEVTWNAVLSIPEHGVKRSLRDYCLAPRFAILDGRLLLGIPPLRFACAVFDALGHLIESVCSSGASTWTDRLAFPAITRLISTLSSGAPPHSIEQADAILEDACCGGICLANARLGAAHGLVAPLGGQHPVGHGHGIACLLGPTLATNYARGSHQVRQRLRLVSQALGTGSDVPAAAARLCDLRAAWGIPGLAECGVTTAHFDAIITAPSGSIKTNPVILTADDLSNILSAAL